MAENETAVGAAAGAAGEGAAADENATAGENAAGGEAEAPKAESTEEITYHAVEKDGQVSAIWEMQGRKHLRTIDPRSRQGQEILRLYTAENQ